MNKNSLPYIVVGIVVAVGIVFFMSRPQPSPRKVTTPAEGTCSVNGCSLTNTTPEASLYPVDTFTHAHGLAVDIATSSKLYIATHEGLYALLNDKDLYQIGKSRDDYMGFSIHPTKAHVVFSSGHPRRGGNIGVQKSEDGGVTWQKISNGVNGPVDFHAMTVSRADPDYLYGWFYGTFQRSRDGGKTWEIAAAKNINQPISLTADRKNPNRVYASTPRGILVSDDGGDSWNEWSEPLQSSVVIALALHPKNPAEALSSSRALGLAKTKDGGKTWTKVSLSRSEGEVIHLAHDPQDAGNVYAVLDEHKLYKSADSGDTWTKLR